MIMTGLQTISGSFDMTNIPVDLQGIAYLLEQFFLYCIACTFFLWIVKSVIMFFAIPGKIIRGK